MSETVSKIYRTTVWGDVSLAVADTTALVNEAIRRHALSPVAASALGRTLTATACLCSWLKEGRSSLSVSISGGGVGGKILAAGDGELRLRGYCENAQTELPPRADGKLDVGKFTGKDGTLTVIRDDGEGLPFVGTCALCSGEIAEDFAAYFTESEQRPTAIALGVKIGRDGLCLGAGGVFLQPFPGAKEENIVRAEHTIHRFSSLSFMIEKIGAEGILREFDADLSHGREISWCCHCSEESAGRAVLALGKKEAEELIRTYGKVTVHCHYCNTNYEFKKDAVNKLFDREETT